MKKSVKESPQDSRTAGQSLMESPNGPPVIELVISLQFAPIKGMSAGVFGRFWGEHFADWNYVSEQEPIEDQFEEFELPYSPRAEVLKLFKTFPKPRHVLADEGNEQILQVQQTRLVLNWRKNATNYPRYELFRERFLACLEQFQQFIDSQKLGPVIPNQWELTYVDFFPQGVDWNDLNDWASVAPGLFSRIGEKTDLKLSNRNASWRFDFPDKSGRLHVTANNGYATLPTKDAAEPQRGLILNFTARGPIDRLEQFEQKLNLAHDKSISLFKSLVSDSIFKRCSQ